MRLEDLRHETSELSCGLRALVVPMPWTHRTGVTLQLRVGPRFESATSNGLSHFLEHMTCRGIPSHPSAHAQALAFESLGGTLLAETGSDTGALSVTVPPESLDAVLPLLAETFMHPVFSDLETEKGIVREELLEGLDEHGQPIDADDLVRAVCFRGHPLGLPITGSLALLDTFGVTELARHHARYYVGSGAVLVVAGPVDAAAVLRRVEAAFSGLAATAAAELASPIDGVGPPAPQPAARFQCVRHSASQTALRVAFRAPAARDPDALGIDLVLRIVDDGMGTRLYHRICDERGLCYEVSANCEAFDDAGIFDVAAECTHERTGDVLGEVLELVRELAAHGPTPAELDRAKARHAWQLGDLLDAPDALAEVYAQALLRGSPLPLSARRERVAAITLEQVRTAAARVFRAQHLSVVAVGMPSRREQASLERLVKHFA